VLNVASADWRELSEEDLRILYTVGDLLSIAIERARLFAKSSQLGALEERNRLAREIHDTLAQGFTAIALRLEMIDALLEGDADIDRARKVVQQALDLSRHNIEEARRSVLDLRAAPLEGRNLCEALERLVEAWEHDGNPKVALEIIGGPRPLHPRLEIGLYRIVQEALTNISRHAKATDVIVRLFLTHDTARVTIEDNGIGFEPYKTIKGRHGLIGMNERARLLGGWLRIQSGPDEGTMVEATLPLE
jgi:two-component system NarL family sensor kinase